ncbi:MAG: hypothetical protein HKN91_15315 [Acidimicrobiia bacterium]|nr:hypothetical protein [Acidimicrobiia bacterium]
MHDKPDSEFTSAPAGSTADLVADLASADPADAPAIADAIAERLEAGLVDPPDEAPPS